MIWVRLAAALLIGFSSAVGPLAAVGAPPTPQRATSVAYDIAPQPLPSAIEAFAAATGLQVLYDLPPGPPPRSPGVSGALTPEAGLQHLLEGTGYVARFNDQGDVVLQPVRPISTAPGDSGEPPTHIPQLVLNSLKVEGATVLEPQSEGGLDLHLYQNLVRSGVRQALSANPRTSKDDYEATLDLLITPAGVIQRARLTTSSGDHGRDRAIIDTIEGVALDQPPPARLPQPVRIVVKSRKRP